MTAVESLEPTPELLDEITLGLIGGVGPRIRRTLLDVFGSATAVLDAAPSQLRAVPGVGPKLTTAIAKARQEIDAAEELEYCRQNQIRLVTDQSDEYPRSLREIHDPPGFLYIRGQLLPRDALAIAVVGSRHATQYGKAQAERLAASLARAGLTIVSGLARGVDAAAHRGALQAGGRTVAVLGSGLAEIYPPEHVELASAVAANGALISELPARVAPTSGTFPQRNRLISGMSLGVLVIEAADRSGALITARHAMEQGREVFAVPGRVDNRMARGCHALIRDGARLVESADDVLEELGPLVAAAPVDEGRSVRHPAELSLNEIEQQVLEAIDSEPTTVDAVIAATKLPAPKVLATVSALEIRRLVRRASGGTVMRL